MRMSQHIFQQVVCTRFGNCEEGAYSHYIDVKHGQKPQPCQPGKDVTNILQAAFSFENVLHRFYVLTVWVCSLLAKGNWRKSCF